MGQAVDRSRRPSAIDEILRDDTEQPVSIKKTIKSPVSADLADEIL